MVQLPSSDAPGSDVSGNAADLAARNRILAGDRREAEQLFRGHLDALYEFAHFRVGGDRALAEEVVQDTFVTAFERLSTYDGRASLHAWLCGIARNKVREHRRRRRGRPIDEVLAESDAEIDNILAQVSREPLPDWVLEQAETRELVGATLSSLPPEYREALVGKYVDELTTAEVGLRLGKGAKAAESTLTRARLAFARVFELLARRRGEVEPHE